MIYKNPTKEFLKNQININYLLSADNEEFNNEDFVENGTFSKSVYGGEKWERALLSFVSLKETSEAFKTMEKGNHNV